MKAIPYGRQDISDEDIAAVVETLKSDFLTQGPKILEFEKAFAHYVNAKYAVAVSNGTAALHLSVLALGLKKGQKVISTPITFAASTNSVLYTGAEVLFADIDKDTFLIDLKQVEELCKTDENIVGIIPVDFAGQTVNTEALRKIADKYNLWIIEDACHSPGAHFTDSNNIKQKCGNNVYSDATVFSFHPVKHIAAGEGGMITTNNKKIYDSLCQLRTHGITKDTNILENNDGGWYYEMHNLGYNYRITDFQAALGLSQLQRANAGIAKRNAIAQKYTKAFENTSITTPITLKENFHAYHLYIIQTEKRKELYEHLQKHKIYSQVHYIPVHTMPYYKQLGFKHGDFPIAEAYYKQCLSLPMFPTLTDREQDFVIQTVLDFIK